MSSSSSVVGVHANGGVDSASSGGGGGGDASGPCPKKQKVDKNEEGKNWFSEKETTLWRGQQMSLRVKRMIVDTHTKYQHLQVFDSESYGRVLVLDGIIQVTERDEFAYQEMIAHVPLFSHLAPHRVLIIGAGDGGVLREVIKHSCVEVIHQVELDEGVVQASKAHFADTMATAFGDPRYTLQIGDGAAFMADTSNHGKWDVIIVDSSDPIGPAAVLFENAFYSNLYQALAPGGVACTQGECMWLHAPLIGRVLAHSRSVFDHAHYYYTTVPTYPSGQIGFFLLGKNRKEEERVGKKEGGERESKQEEEKEKEESNGSLFCRPVRKTTAIRGLRYYSAAIHQAAFVLPPFVREAISSSASSAS